MSDVSWQELAGIWGPGLLGLALGVLGVWAWTVRLRRPRLAKAVGWGLAVYLLLGAISWAVFLTGELPQHHPEWFEWIAAAETSP